MQVRSIGFAAVTAAITGIAPAAAADMPPAPILKAPPPATGGFWIGAEALVWSQKGDRLPPLVTTSPAGTPLAQAGVLGQPGTSVLFGSDSLDDRWRAGVRVRAGYWFDPAHTRGIEASGFVLDRNTTNFAANSGSNPILAQPFVDASTGLQNAVLVAFPGQSTGSVAASDTSRLFGAGAAYRMEFCKTCAFGSLSGIVGYRYLRLQDHLAVTGTAVALGGIIPAGTTISTTDRFRTANDFHGLDLGLKGEAVSGPWTLMWSAKVAVGGTFADVDIDGTNTIAVPAVAPVTSVGGVYAQPTNIGSHSSSRFSVVPELDANVSYRVNTHLRAFAGYSLLYWTGVVRPGGAIDSTINTSQLGGFPLIGAARPQARLDTTDYWAHGLNAGLVYEF
jgi:hypothetical protein